MSGWQWVIVVGISGFVVLMLSQVAVGMRAGVASIADKQLQLGREHEIKLAVIEASMFEKALAAPRSPFTMRVPVPDLLGRSAFAPSEEPNPIGRERFAAADDPPFEGTTDEVNPA